MNAKSQNKAKVLVTGAAGQLGTAICLMLLESDIPFLAIDKNPGLRTEYPIKIIDLLYQQKYDELFEGVSALIHTANHPNWFSSTPQKVYTENTIMNMNLFHAAAYSECKRIVFSSSIQVLNGQLPSHDRSEQEILLPYIPMDSNMPDNPRNTYALSKQASENTLRYFSKTKEISCVSLRYPWLLNIDLLQKAFKDGGIKRENCYDGFTYLPLYSAAELAIKGALGTLEGYRAYFVASKDNLEQTSANEIIKRELSHLPLKKSIQEIDSLVDCSKVEKELGWKQPKSLKESYLKYTKLEGLRKK